MPISYETMIKRELNHLPFTPDEGYNDTLLNREINQKITDGYFENNFFPIIALPKTASTAIRNCMSYLFQEYIGDNGYFEDPKYQDGTRDYSIRLEIVKDYKKGGIYKNHSPPISTNIKNLMILKSRALVIIRHPADFIVAQYCDYNRAYSDKIHTNRRDDSLIFNPFIPMKFGDIKPSKDMENVITYYLEDGLLYAALNWMTDWIYRIRYVNGRILSYESFMDNKINILCQLSNYFFNSLPDAKQRKKLEEILEGTIKERIEDINFKKYYPRGYTDKVGICNDYFTDKHKKLYLKQVKSFLKCHPYANLLREAYPNLLDLDNLGV